MRNLKIFFILTLVTLTLISCKTTKNSTNITVYKDSINISNSNKINILFEKGKEFNHPTFVIWKEDLQGNYVETIFITKSYASGIFGHNLVGDSIWMPNPGPSYQPAALPYWTYKKGYIDDEYLVPTPKHPYVDAYSGATPITDFQYETSYSDKKEEYRILVEVNQTWDWNDYWTNNKFPENSAYKHSAQPSIIYSVTTNNQDSIYFLNPIGHGDAKGESGKLFTNLSSLTTAKDIFKTIKISIY